LARKLFCELNPLTYKISVAKGTFLRKIIWLKNKDSYVKEFSEKKLDYKIYEHKSLIRRKLGNVDMHLQNNKATNLSLAAPKINGVIIWPNEVFSFWKLVGNCDRKKGYQEGLVIKSGQVSQGIGGGMCQLTNLIHWMVLHSPLTIIEHHHHNQIDMFPDYGRQVPFGSGTSVMYNYLDYQFVNRTNQTFQLITYTTNTHLCGELRSDQDLDYAYHVIEEKSCFVKEKDGYYRNNEIYQQKIDKASGNQVAKTLIVKNHAKVLYDSSFIPKKIYRLTAFSDIKIGGNLAGVVLDSDELAEADMLKIAKEVGYSETAFVMQSKKADYKIRFFTPTDEVNLCGHATVATFNLLRDLKLISIGSYTQETKAGILKVIVGEDHVYMEQTQPSYYDIIEAEELIPCFENLNVHNMTRLPIQIVSTGNKDIILPMNSLSDLLHLSPNHEKIQALSEKYDVVGIHAFCFETISGCHAHTRNFAPRYGINEESATGTSNGALACYLMKYGHDVSDEFTIEQGYSMDRPSKIRVKIKGTQKCIDEVYVGGSAIRIK